MPRKPRHGHRICARCKQRETPSVYRTYCDDCYRQYEAERRARRLAAAMAEGSDIATNEHDRRRYAVIWQQHNEGLIIGPFTEIDPPPSGYAITAPGRI